jgi:hypothetical protein
MPSQLHLFTGPRENANVGWLEKLLLEAGTWRTASEILQAVNWESNDTNKRFLRSLAEASDYILSGQRGYKHAGHATAEEIRHSSNWLVSQGKKMIKRGIAQRRRAHAIFG